MSDRFAFETAVNVLLRSSASGTSLCQPFLTTLPVDGAAISTLGPPFARETLCATDATAARFDEIQLDLGEGPLWSAAETRRPMLVGDIRGPADAATESRWPTLREHSASLEIAAVYAFPLMVGSLTVGAVDLHSRVAGLLDPGQVVDAQVLAGIAARHVLRRALSGSAHEAQPDEDGELSRRAVHQATGMVLAQLNSTAGDALLIIHGHAFASGRSVRAVAADVVARRLDFSALDES
ncbi:GAF domain-containing protein [Cryobacterium frigoriphilum]|uniref:GAF domain-containing protein n=1 Tax=Cryobacterium frigoriphilum TaxID=1259150 RepID=A0A4R9A0H2_9MICO|nr:GAF domain-containing protein [Cryobacterium frigoriphilum]TFD49658.1 GAF domain-containing protein [Cryobacterium frigoriphilum]